MSPPELGRARPHLRAPGPAATQTHCARRRYRVRSPCRRASRPALMMLVSQSHSDVAPGACAPAPPLPRAGACSSHLARTVRCTSTQPFRARARDVRRTFTMSQSFTPRAHNARYSIQFTCRPQSLRAPEHTAATQTHFVRARYHIRSPCLRASRGPSRCRLQNFARVPVVA